MYSGQPPFLGGRLLPLWRWYSQCILSLPARQNTNPVLQDVFYHFFCNLSLKEQEIQSLYNTKKVFPFLTLRLPWWKKFHIQNICWRVLTHLQRFSQCILQPQLTGLPVSYKESFFFSNFSECLWCSYWTCWLWACLQLLKRYSSNSSSLLTMMFRVSKLAIKRIKYHNK